MSMFEQAFRLQLRFESAKGLLTVEDLWNLPLTSDTSKANLDDLARDLYHKVKSAGEVSFVTEAKTDPTVQLAFDIVKHVIGVRLEENKAAEMARQNKALKQKLMEVLDRKENAALENLTPDELRQKIEGL